MRSLVAGFALLFVLAAPANAAYFTMRCTIDGIDGEVDFMFDTRSPEVLQRRVDGGVLLAKYKTLEMTYAEVIFGKFALMGQPKQRFKVSRGGGPLFESLRGATWSDWKPVGQCRKQ